MNPKSYQPAPVRVAPKGRLWLGKATYYVVRRDVSSDARAGLQGEGERSVLALRGSGQHLGRMAAGALTLVAVRRRQ